MHAYGDTAAIVYNGEATVFVYDNFDVGAIPCQMFVDRVVDDLPDQVVETLYIRASDIHARPLTDGF